MFTAVIENEGNTLVMEFPCKRYLMADHLGSIGIRRSAHEIKCMDEEDEPIKVKLFGNNEFEKRLTLLVSPSDTLMNSVRYFTPWMKNRNKQAEMLPRKVTMTKLRKVEVLLTRRATPDRIRRQPIRHERKVIQITPQLETDISLRR